VSPHVAIRSKTRWPQRTAVPLGPFFPRRSLARVSKKSLHGTGWCFQCREVGRLSLGPRRDSYNLASRCLINKRQSTKQIAESPAARGRGTTRYFESNNASSEVSSLANARRLRRASDTAEEPACRLRAPCPVVLRNRKPDARHAGHRWLDKPAIERRPNRFGAARQAFAREPGGRCSASLRHFLNP
jgi:hypothetical protein